MLVSVKGRVAVYDLPLKLAAAFTLRLSSAPVASIKIPLSIPAAGTPVSNRPISAAAISSHNATSSQKVFFCAFNVKLQCTFLHPFHPSFGKMRKIKNYFPSARKDENSRSGKIFQSFRLIDNQLFFFLLLFKKEAKGLHTWIFLKDWLGKLMISITVWKSQGAYVYKHFSLFIESGGLQVNRAA